LVPRLLLELGKHDRVIALWVQRQVQLMQATPAKKGRVAIQAGVAEKLVLWHHGEMNRTWFAMQYAADPLPPKFVIPLRVRADKGARESMQWMLWIAVFLGCAFLGRQVLTGKSTK